MPYSDSDGAGGDALDDVRGVAAIAGTGAPLGAAPARSAGPPSPAAPPGDTRPASAVVAEYAGVRVVGPLQWSVEAESPTVTGMVSNTGAQVQTMVLTLFWLDARGQRLGTTEAVVWDLAPGESRPFAQAQPAQASAATEVSARLEPLVP
ncbi:MAG TPA: FxLYD domain-containing protein [Chloroflexota bacterium]